ncbi:MAG: AbrB/MazE/SpoVT family DNA-binding domain-containing protein [Candidatus Aminicenantes bacterium]|nr:AbrB/MazE/SpoVT family DNA-binding domain-containing protein [Candidatus Aminicenantes bacterium]
MISRIQKWGNSVAVRIPKAFADEMNVTENASIDMMMREGALIITPMEEPKRITTRRSAWLCFVQ